MPENQNVHLSCIIHAMRQQVWYIISALMFVAGAYIAYQGQTVYGRSEIAAYGVVLMVYSIVRLFLMKRFRAQPRA